MPEQPKKRLMNISRHTRIGRSAAVNHALSVAKQRGWHGAAALLSPGPLLAGYIRFLLTPRHKFMDYSRASKNGRYAVERLAGQTAIRIAIAGDWATGAQESQLIADLMSAASPDFTIHLGDVYYVGDEAEIRQNCLGEDSDLFEGVVWPHGTRGSFSLNGNHEMYSNGRAYFDFFLKTLGMTGDAEGQWASFFCLEIRDWRIIALDTGYHSIGWPILSLIPAVSSIPFVGGNSHLPGALLKWLRKVIDPAREPKATLLLSHHQYFSAFERAYTKPAQQLREIFGDQEVVWLWGHEHRLGIYDRFSTDGGLTAYGRCIGHGGMPVEQALPDPAKAPLQ